MGQCPGQSGIGLVMGSHELCSGVLLSPVGSMHVNLCESCSDKSQN